jgi:hypothetical protein
MGTVPTVTKVYNILPPDVSQIVLNNPASIFEGGVSSNVKETKFVMGFRERLKVSASISAVKATPSVLEEGDITPTAAGSSMRSSGAAIAVTPLTPTEEIWKQGEAVISLSPFDNFVLFVLYDNTLQEATGAKQPQLLDVTNMGTFYLSFTDESTGDEVRISNYTNVKDLSPIKGELLFKITKEEASKILKHTSKNFYVSSRLELNDTKSDETLVYFGKWYKIDEKIQIRDSEIIAGLNKQIASSSIATVSEVAKLTENNNALKAQNLLLTDENNNLKRSLSHSADILAQFNASSAETIRNLVRGETKIIQDLNVVSAVGMNISERIKSGDDQFISQKSFNSMKGQSIKNIKL